MLLTLDDSNLTLSLFAVCRERARARSRGPANVSIEYSNRFRWCISKKFKFWRSFSASALCFLLSSRYAFTYIFFPVFLFNSTSNVLVCLFFFSFFSFSSYFIVQFVSSRNNRIFGHKNKTADVECGIFLMCMRMCMCVCQREREEKETERYEQKNGIQNSNDDRNENKAKESTMTRFH